MKRSDCSRFVLAGGMALLLAAGLAACGHGPAAAPPPDSAAPATPTPPLPPLPPAAPAAPAAPVPPPPPTLEHAEAVLSAAHALFSKANLAAVQASAGGRYTVLIDPLIDGVTRMQTKATQAIEARIVQLARSSYPQFELKPFSAAALAQSPLLVVGTFTPINQQGKTEGERAMYRFCLAMVDLKSGRLVSKTVARSRMETVDATPLAFFADAPAWSKDAYVDGYVKTCQASKAGDAIQASYVESLVTASLVDAAVRAYNAAQYREALQLFTQAQASSAGQQLRVLNGLYLANWKLGRREAALQSFGQIVDYGLAQGQLAMLLLFGTGSTSLAADSKQAPNELWLKSIAQRLGGRQGACLEVAGHASRGGSEVLNERLSALRAEHVRRRLLAEMPALARRIIAAGYGSRETLIGTGRDDASDMLDRRVEFRPLACQA